jgi:aspartyl-tRNA(Asn)/glutamyl-tRNA(Gln) amidotransferase subunit A
LTNIRIGVPVEYNIAELSEEIRTAWKSTLRLLEASGAKIMPISLPNTKHALSAYYIIAPAEAASNLSKYDGVRYGSRSAVSDGAGDVLYSQTRGEGFGDEVKRRILLGSYTLSSEAIDNYFIKAQKVRRLIQQDFDRVFSAPNPLRPTEQFNLSDMDESIPLENRLGPSQVDFIICPTAPTIPPLLQQVSEQTSVDTYMNDIFTVPSSLAGLPAISVPYSLLDRGQTSGDLGPAGMQIIGQFADDFRVLSLATILERLQREEQGSFVSNKGPGGEESLIRKVMTPANHRITKFESMKTSEKPLTRKPVSIKEDKPLIIRKVMSINGGEKLSPIASRLPEIKDGEGSAALL